MPSLRIIICSNNDIESISILPSKIERLYCEDNYNLRYINIINNNIILRSDKEKEYWIKINQMRRLYYSMKYSIKLEGYFYRFIKKMKEQIHMEILYSPDLGFYKEKWTILQKYIKCEKIEI